MPFSDRTLEVTVMTPAAGGSVLTTAPEPPLRVDVVRITSSVARLPAPSAVASMPLDVLSVTTVPSIVTRVRVPPEAELANERRESATRATRANARRQAGL